MVGVVVAGVAGDVGALALVLDLEHVEFSVGEESQGVNYVVAAAGDIEDGKYQWAAVQSPEGPIGWILAREPQIDAETRSQAEAALKEAGIDVSQLSDTAQPPQTYQPGQ